MRAVVVGAGAAGTAAALALRHGGAEVIVVDGPMGATSACSGAWDVASVSSRNPLTATSLSDRVRKIADEHARHPYAHIDTPVETIERVHEALFAVLGGYRSVDMSSPGLRVATDAGVIRHVASAHESILDLDRAPDGLVAVAALDGHREVDGRFIARSLSEDPSSEGLSFVDVPVEFLNRRSDALMWSHEAAALGDAADARARLAVVLRRALPQAGPHAWLLPPLLGIETDGIAMRLEAELGHPVGEVAKGGAGPQGWRLSRGLRSARAAADVTEVVARAGLRKDGRVSLLDGNVLDADAVILATGTAIAGGLTPTAKGLVEPLTGTEVAVESSGDLRTLGVSGVRYDRTFRLLDDDGGRVRDTLFVCGSILDGVSHADGTGLGAAVTTGWLAGEAALAG